MRLDLTAIDAHKACAALAARSRNAMNYIEPGEAQNLPGLRLALTAGLPGPWSESAKAVFAVKGIPYVPVAQYAGKENRDLVAWTGCRNAPIAILDGEKPRTGWAEILLLAERLKPEIPLLPDDPAERALVFGLAHEICGEEGFGWTRRVTMFDGILAAVRNGAEIEPGIQAMLRDYRITEAASAAAPARLIGILGMLAARLHAQHTAGGRYLVGDRLTACDLYWACFAGMLDPLPAEINPMPNFLRTIYAGADPALAAAKDPILFEHRDFIYATHLTLPLDF
jgi:glutathione S-transferase